MNKDKIENLLLYYGVKNYVINNDFTVDVDGDLSLWPDDYTVDVDGDLVLWPDGKPFTMDWLEYFRFGMVNGDVHGEFNGLITLEGLPNWVSGDYYVNNNHLTSLKYLPKYIGGDLYIHHNKLEELDLGDTYIGGEIYAWANPKLDKLNQEWAYSGERGVDKIGSIKGYYLHISREKKINSIING